MPPKILLIFTCLVLCQATIAGEFAPAAYAGRTVCTECHEQQVSKWAGSHHDRAMEIADAGTVLGDFDNASLTHQGVTSISADITTGGKSDPVIPLEDGYIKVTLPKIFTRDQPKLLSIRWVDFLR